MHPDLRLANLSATSSDTFYLRATSRAHDDEAADMSIILRYKGGAWANYEIDAPVVAHCAIETDARYVFSLTPGGDVHVAGPSGFSWEKVDSDSKTSPNRLRQMRSLCSAGESLFAVGMGRMAYERTLQDGWRRIDEGMRNLTGGGLLSVSGCSRACVYACGFGGEVWRFDGSSWQPIDSPTNAKLEQVLVVSPDEVVFCGARGLVALSDGEHWKFLEPTASKSTLWGLAKFNGDVYVADSAQVYRVSNDALEPMPLLTGKSVTTGRLQSADGVLWSIGENDLLSFDGSTWRVVDYS
jgi:hypothetical protein